MCFVWFVWLEFPVYFCFSFCLFICVFEYIRCVLYGLCGWSFQFIFVLVFVCLFVCLNTSGVFCMVCVVGVSSLFLF